MDEPFLLHNVDVISNIDLRAMLQFHTENEALATLAVQSRETSRPSSSTSTSNSAAAASTTKIPSFRAKREISLPLRHSPLATRHFPKPRTIACRNRRRLSFRAKRGICFFPIPRRRTGPLQALAFSGIHILSPASFPAHRRRHLPHHPLLPSPRRPRPKNPSLPRRPILLARPRPPRRPRPSRPRFPAKRLSVIHSLHPWFNPPASDSHCTLLLTIPIQPLLSTGSSGLSLYGSHSGRRASSAWAN